MGQVIAVVSGKGGTGKTSFTALVGASLARLGFKTLCIDCDIGLRNLDLALGLSDRALMDFSDVFSGRVTLDKAVVQHPGCEKLYLLNAPMRSHSGEITEERMRKLLHEVRKKYDYCLIDSGAGLGFSFRLATCDADRAVVIATTDQTSLRDAQHTVIELKRFGSGKLHLVVNRVRKKVLMALETNLDDAIDAAGLPLLGVIPEDDEMHIAMGRNTLAQLFGHSYAEEACHNIACRLSGEHIPLMKLPKR